MVFFFASSHMKSVLLGLKIAQIWVWAFFSSEIKNKKLSSLSLKTLGVEVAKIKHG